METVAALVAVRLGSQRLKNKNLSRLRFRNLLEHKISQLQGTPSIDQVVVATDSDRMSQTAKRMGADVIFRSLEWADDEHGNSLGATVRHLALQLTCEHLFWAQVTSPLVKPSHYEQALKIYLRARERGFDSLISVEKLYEFLWDASGPINYGAGGGHVRSQDLPDLYRMTFGLLLAPRESMIEWSYYHGPKPYRVTMDKAGSVDIDDKFDLLVARKLLRLPASQLQTLDSID